MATRLLLVREWEKIGKFIFGIGLGVKDQIISKKYDYKIIKHFKQVTVYKNGHGIIETRFKIKVFNPENFKKFCRNINILMPKLQHVFRILTL